jgi:hypothetical protein
VIEIVNEKLVDINKIISRVLDLTIASKGLYGSEFDKSALI